MDIHNIYDLEVLSEQNYAPQNDVIYNNLINVY